ncbi:MAG: GGDEF domain-containing protein [Phycisphaerae bacterium]|nr:GGDEF domain-containing protein [Phycisphaerae bacterium]
MSGPSAASGRGTGGAGDAPARGALRVVLVGRTGLESSLRRDGRFELQPAPGPIEAVGELASPIDAESPDTAVVLVSEESDRSMSAAERDDFGAAVRRVDPGARRVIVRTGGSERPDYDGALGPDAGPDEVRRAAGGGERPSERGHEESRPGRETEPGTAELDQLAERLIASLRPEEPHAHAPGAVSAPAAAASEPAAPIENRSMAGAAEFAGEESVLRALLAGRDAALPALELIRRRTGARDVVLHAPGEASPAGRTSVPIGAEAGAGEPTGSLSSAVLDRAGLADAARWLGLWLSLRDRLGRLRQMAFTDRLTGAFNRRYFETYLGHAIEHARRERQTVSVLLFDIDNFKHYNDRYGHAAGDEILRETVGLLKSGIRPSDRVCRIGGDEFAVVFFEPTGPRQPASKPPSDIWRLATRFQRQICEHRFPKLGDQAAGTLTISGGLATYPWDGTSAQDLLDRADELALQSKRQGKNVITLGPGARRVCEGGVCETDA